MNLNDRTYGVEIETISPTTTYNRANLARDLTAAGVPAFDAGYSHTPSERWKIVSDNSLTEGRRGPGMELVSPSINPLRGEEGFATIAQVSEVLRSKDFSVDKSCGLHVHTDVRQPELDIAALRRLAMLYVESEEILDSIMPPSRRHRADGTRVVSDPIRSDFARSMKHHPNVMERLSRAADVTEIVYILNGQTPPRFGATRGRRRASLRTPFGRMDLYRLRFVKLNMQTWVYGTSEFRHHAGTIDSNKINNWVLACLRMVDYAANAVSTEEVIDATRRTFATVRAGTKRALIHAMLLRPEGVTLAEALAATGWRQASIAGIAHQYGLEVRQERVRAPLGGYETRYWGTVSSTPQLVIPARGTILPGPKPTNIDEFADKIGMSPEEKTFWHSRAERFALPTANLMVE